MSGTSGGPGELALRELTEVDAHRRGHFLLSSGLHSSDYLQCALYLSHPDRAERAGRLLAAALADGAPRPRAVVAPALGAVVIGHETARALGVRSLFTERRGGAMELRRGFTLAAGEPVVVVEDVVTTGRSTRETIDVVERAGGRVVAVGSLVDRSGGAEPFGELPYRGLLTARFPSWSPDDCPLCRDGVPIDTPGSRRSGG